MVLSSKHNMGGLHWALLGVLALMPWPLASNRVWLTGFWLLVTGLLVLVQLWSRGMRWSFAPALRVHFLLLGLWTLYLGLQCLPLRGAFGPFLDSGALSVDPWSSRAYFVKGFLLLLLHGLMVRSFEGRAQWQTLTWTWLLTAVAVAVAAVVLFAGGQDYTLFFVEVPQGTRARGPFVYQNQFAGYMEMMLALGMGWMISQLGERHAGVTSLLYKSLQFLGSSKAILRVMLVILVIGLIASRSRMGNSAFFGCLWVVGGATLLALRRRDEQRNRGLTRLIGLFMVSVLVIDVVIIGGVVGIDKVIHRIEATHLEAQARQQVATGQAAEPSEESLEQRVGPGLRGLAALKDTPWLGLGGGTFHLGYFPYRTADVQGYYDHAHDDYVEFGVEAGLVGSALLLALVGWSQWRGWRLLLGRDTSRFERGMAFASVMGVSELLVHSTVDFNLQNPTNALLFLWLLALPHQLQARRARYRSIGEKETVSQEKLCLN